jgi:hypothetical protein
MQFSSRSERRSIELLFRSVQFVEKKKREEKNREWKMEKKILCENVQINYIARAEIPARVTKQQ